MIAIKGFDHYDFCPRKCEIFTAKGILKSYFDKSQKYWWLYVGEEKIKVTLGQIFIENMEEIKKEIIRKMTKFELNLN